MKSELIHLSFLLPKCFCLILVFFLGLLLFCVFFFCLYLHRNQQSTTYRTAINTLSSWTRNISRYYLRLKQLTYTYVSLGSFAECSALQLLFDMQWTSHLGSFQLTWSIALLVTIEKHCFISLIHLTGTLLLTERQVAGKNNIFSKHIRTTSKCWLFLFLHIL